jgi:glycine cleavage system H lipoate-binding protein
MCHIRKSIQSKQRVEKDSVVLVGLRDYSEKKGDIVYVYLKEEVELLRRKGEIPTLVGTEATGDMLEDDIVFEEVTNFDDI